MIQEAILKWLRINKNWQHNNNYINVIIVPDKAYDANFKKYHYIIVEMVDEEDLLTEQAILDNHNDRASDFFDCLQQLQPVLEMVSQKTLPQIPLDVCSSGYNIS